MLIAVIAFGILAQAEAFKVLSNITDSSEGPSVSIPRIETEEATSYPPREEDDDPMLNITSTLHPDIPKSSYDVSSVLLTETNASIFPKTNNSLFYQTNTSLLRHSNATVFPEADFTVHNETNYLGFPELNTTVAPKLIISHIPEVSTKMPFPKCPNIGGPEVAGSVVKCYCKGNQIYVNGKCQVYDGAIVIPVELDWINTKEANVKNYNVMERDVNCDTSKHSYMNFTKNQFRLRPRGDVVLLKEAGELEGQRINKYCFIHHLDEYGDLTCTMKACVPIPSVPRCCPPGKAMKEGKCEDANTPDVLKPPISAKPRSDGINWGNITDYYNPVKCDSEYEHLMTIPLGHKQSYLLSLANSVVNGWVPGYIEERRVYYNCPDYCVDGIKNSDGSVDYSTHFCDSHPLQKNKDACAKGSCVRKCCKYGYSVDINRYGCIPDPNSTFNNFTSTFLSHINIVTGLPLCAPFYIAKEKVVLDDMGRLILKDKEFTSPDFCLDAFLNKEHRENSAFLCLTETSPWLKVRQYLVPICNVISLTFLMITIVCYLLVPKSLANGGLYQLCHVIALSITNITSFSVHVFHGKFRNDVCVDLAIAMQFGFLTTFFWLNVMCFEIWRKIRRLKNYRPCKSYPNKYYMMYGWGIPFCICVITILMQKYAPENVLFVIKPYIGDPRCWFREDIALLIYYYGPIAVLFLFDFVFLVLTYINHKIMLRNHEETTNDLNTSGAGVISEQPNMPSSIPSGQITNHVQDFSQKLRIFILMAACWVTDVLSWKIPLLGEWALSDTLNSLQGFFLFIILLSKSIKQKHLEKKYPRIYRWIRKLNCLPANMKRWLQNSVNRTSSPMSSLTPSISNQFSNSTVTNTLTTSIQSPNPSSASFDLSSSSISSNVQSSVSFDNPDKGIGVLSHSSLRRSDSTQNLADPSLQSSKSPEVIPDFSC